MTDKDYLKLAVETAKESVKQGGFPAGAILVKDEKIISKGLSLGFSTTRSNKPRRNSCYQGSL